MLIEAVPDLNAELVRASQKWLSPQYQDDAPRWGEQKLEVWTNYADWMYDHKLLDKRVRRRRRRSRTTFCRISGEEEQMTGQWHGTHW